ncbi:MAG: NAD(P)/FAD-dependent oxidoreductase [Candidatus Binatia bacterium]
MSQALIIGAGPAGLTAAYELGKLGKRATVLEADEDVGGLARTVSYQGYRFDIGGHRFFSKVPLVNALWRELLGGDFLLRPRLSRIFYRGHFFDYPLKPLNALRGLGVLESLLVSLSYAKARLAPSREETSFEDWVSNRFGQRLYRIFFKTYTEKVWGIPCSEISSEWAVQRIKNLSLGEALRHALFKRHGVDGRIITSLIDEFHYPRLGPGMMWERCAGLVERGGGSVIRGIRVERICHAGGRVERVVARRRDGEALEFPAANLISSMPIRDLVRALDPAAPDEVRRAADRLRYRDYISVVLIVRRETVFPDNWLYVHSPDVKLGRIQNYKNWSPEMVPDPSRTSLGLEYFLWEQDAEWSWPDERLIDQGIRDCAEIGIIDPSEIEDGTVVRVPKAYPVYDRGYRDQLTIVRDYLARLTNLQLIGRNGQHRYNNQDHSMLAGVYAAHNLDGEQRDVWSVNTEAAYQEELGEPSSADRLVPVAIAARSAAPLSDRQVVERIFARLDPVALGAAFAVVVAVGLFLATAVLLVRGGPQVRAMLSLLGEYLVGYRVTWPGALIGSLEAGMVGFAFGYAAAELRNRALAAYGRLLQRRAAAELRRRVLDEV